MRPPLDCIYCGVLLARSRGFVASTNDHLLYCSRRCYGAHKTWKAEQRRIERQRRQTERRIERHRLALEHSQAMRRERAERRRQQTMRIVQCWWCQRMFQRSGSTHNHAYCSRRCARRWYKVKRRHHLTDATGRDVVQDYRLRGLAVYASQKPGGAMQTQP